MSRSASLIRLIKPETELERELLHTPEFQVGMCWGEPRFGHPEGKVGLHVREVLDNIDATPQTLRRRPPTPAPGGYSARHLQIP